MNQGHQILISTLHIPVNICKFEKIPKLVQDSMYRRNCYTESNSGANEKNRMFPSTFRGGSTVNFVLHPSQKRLIIKGKNYLQIGI